MISSKKCPNCGNDHIAGPHRVHGYQGHVSIDLPGMKTATLDSFTCSNCGYTEFYVDKRGLHNINQVGRFLPELSSESPILSEEWCHTCGFPIKPDYKFCKECGSRVD